MQTRYHFFDTLDSTNDTARDPKYGHGDVIVAEHQRCGRGQRGNRWSSAAGQNLTLSVVLEPDFLRAEEQFLLLQCVALALTDMFLTYGLAARIKWTNDIYIGDRKITGILMEQSLRGEYLNRCVVGIGINVNQERFEQWIPNPTSLVLETGRRAEPRQVLDRLCTALGERYEALRLGAREKIVSDYLCRMYRLGQRAEFSLVSGERFAAVIRGVMPSGELMLETTEGRIETFLFGRCSL